MAEHCQTKVNVKSEYELPKMEFKQLKNLFLLTNKMLLTNQKRNRYKIAFNSKIFRHYFSYITASPIKNCKK